MTQHIRCVLMSLALSAAPAYAGFSVVKPPPPTPAPAPGATATAPKGGLAAVRFVGTPTGPIDTRFGFGRDVTLAEALRQIAPVGWHAKLKEGMLGHFDRARRVSWRGGRPWTSVLDGLATEQGFSVEVDWANRQLMVGPRLPTPALASAQTMPLAPSAPKAPPVPTWVAARGTMLSADLAAWCKTAGWELRWNAADLDYAIPAPLSFQGSLESAVKAALQHYAHATRPLVGDSYPSQKLIIVSEAKPHE